MIFGTHPFLSRVTPSCLHSSGSVNRSRTAPSKRRKIASSRIHLFIVIGCYNSRRTQQAVERREEGAFHEGPHECVRRCPMSNLRGPLRLLTIQLLPMWETLHYTLPVSPDREGGTPKIQLTSYSVLQLSSANTAGPHSHNMSPALRATSYTCDSRPGY
jgi:hypothetical protein